MKSRYIVQSIISALMIALPLWVWAASGDASNWSGTTATTNTDALLLSGITVEDDMHITMEFTQNIVIESVRIRIAKQSDGTNIKIDSLTGVLDNTTSVYVSLTDVLEAGEAYTMTVISALSDKWVTITEGTDALSEFAAPKPLKQSLVVFNAPANPSATVAEDTTPEPETTDVSASTTEIDTPVATEAPPVPENSELPLTGTNPALFLILSGVLALILLLKRKAH